MVDPILALGAAVATAACKLWLKDVPIAGDVSAKAITIVESKISGVRERRRAARIFEGIEEGAADFITATLEAEFRGLADNERLAAIAQATSALNSTPLSAPDLLASDLDPLYLARTVRLRNPKATRDLSGAAAGLYDRIIQYCCIYIVNSANSLPGFEVGAFAELLQRHSETMQRLDRLSETLAEMRTTEPDEFFESNYKNLVLSQLDYVQLFGFTVSDKLRRYPLTASYLALTATSGASGTPALEACGSSDEKENVLTGDGAENTIHAILSRSSRTLVRGEAGCGKTTLLQWLAVAAASKRHEGSLQTWNDGSPFLIRLRDYVGKPLPSPEAFLEGVGRHISEEMPRGWVHARLRSGAAIVLVDGIDELPEADRSSTFDWLRDLVGAFPDAGYVVTSRPAAASPNWLDDLGFQSADIQSMSLSDSRELIRLWHVAMRSTSVDVDEIRRIDEAELSLLEALTARRHLRHLVASPLLAAMLCALNLDRRMQLPTDKLELYSVAIEALVDRRDNERKIHETGVEFPKAARLLVLEDLSYWMLRNGLTSAPRHRVVTQIARRLGGIPRATCTGEEAIRVLLNRSGIVREPVPGTIDFVHRTFQEYLAAKAAIDTDDIEFLLARTGDDQWRETTMIACGLAHVGQREILIQGVLQQIASKRGRESAKLKAMAVGCLQMSPQLSEELQNELQTVAQGLLPPRSNSIAEALSSVGELALELLPAGPFKLARVAAATVRLAGLIGGEHALRIIESYANRPELEVVDEIDGAWSRFEILVYAERVLSKRVPYRRLLVDDPVKLPALLHVKSTNIELRFRQGYGSVAFTSDLPELSTLYVNRDPKLRDLSPLARHPKLRSLFLREVNAPSLRPLHVNTKLTRLELDSRAAGLNLAELELFPHLTELHLTNPGTSELVLNSLNSEARLDRIGFWDASDVTSLNLFVERQQLENLNFLLLGQAKHLRSVAGISRWAGSCTGLFLHAVQVTDLTELTRMPALNFLNLRSCSISDLGFMEALQDVRTLHIGGTVQTPVLDPLHGHPRLERLYIYGSDPIDLTPLQNCRALKEVRVHTRKWADVRGVGPLSAKSILVRLGTY